MLSERARQEAAACAYCCYAITAHVAANVLVSSRGMSPHECALYVAIGVGRVVDARMLLREAGKVRFDKMEWSRLPVTRGTEFAICRPPTPTRRYKQRFLFIATKRHEASHAYGMCRRSLQARLPPYSRACPREAEKEVKRHLQPTRPYSSTNKGSRWQHVHRHRQQRRCRRHRFSA